MAAQSSVPYLEAVNCLLSLLSVWRRSSRPWHRASLSVWRGARNAQPHQLPTLTAVTLDTVAYYKHPWNRVPKFTHPITPNWSSKSLSNTPLHSCRYCLPLSYIIRSLQPCPTRARGPCYMEEARPCSRTHLASTWTVSRHLHTTLRLGNC
jgi:hypothetical protein